MECLKQREFQDRVEAVARARKIFIPHITKNISIAFQLYQEILAKQERKLTLTTKEGGRRPRTWLDQYERPKCPKCGEELYLRIVKEPKGRGNQKGWKSCWECLGLTCFYEEYSKKPIKRLIKKLRRKTNA